MKNKITPHFFEEHLIISLSKDWINKFKQIPEFIVHLNKEGKLCLQSTCCVKGDKR